MPDDSLPTPAEPNLDSFVLRFVSNREGPSVRAGAESGSDDGCGAVGWHGVIRHVQTNRERAFSRWTDAVAFISEFVHVGENKDE